MEPVLEEDLGHGFVAKVVFDDDPLNPRVEWDNVGKIDIFVDKYSGIGDKDAHSELVDAIEASKYYKQKWNEECDYGDLRDIIQMLDACKDIISLPVYLYDHSGITVSTGPFNCRFDSGMVGVIFVTRETAIKEFGKKIMTKAVAKKAEEYLESEIKTLDNYCTGMVYGYTVEDPDGEVVDSCWGFYGEEKYAMEQAKENAEYHIKEWLEKTPGQLP